MKTPEETKKGLEACRTDECFAQHTLCPYSDDKLCVMHVCGDALALIEHIEAKVPKWISVDDKDPEFPCITYDGENPPKIPHVIHTLINGDGEKRHFSYDPFEMEKFFRDQGQYVDMFSMTHITYWMPVPELPEDGGKQ